MSSVSLDPRSTTPPPKDISHPELTKPVIVQKVVDLGLELSSSPGSSINRDIKFRPGAVWKSPPKKDSRITPTSFRVDSCNFVNKTQPQDLSPELRPFTKMDKTLAVHQSSSSIASGANSAAGSLLDLQIVGAQLQIVSRPVTPKSRLTHISKYERHFFKHAQVFNPSLSQVDFKEVFQSLSEILIKISEPKFLGEYIAQKKPEGSSDIDTTPLAFLRFEQMLEKFQNQLAHIGIPSLAASSSKKFCFWTGSAGQEMANQEDFICDDKVPMIHFLVECWKSIDKSDELHLQLPYLFSLIYANLASGDVAVYVSSVGSEGKAVINVNSALWVELNVLINNKKVRSIQTYFIDKKDQESKWIGPFDLKQDYFQKCSEYVELSRRRDTASVKLDRMSGYIARWSSSSSRSSSTTTGSSSSPRIASACEYLCSLKQRPQSAMPSYQGPL